MKDQSYRSRPIPKFTIDQGLEALGKDIINKRRPYLKAAKIAYLFRPEAPVSNGRVTPGMCIRVDDRNRAVHEHDFLIEIARDVWDDATTDFRRALLDHELGHCGIRMDDQGLPMKDPQTGQLKTYVKPHDLEEFSDVLEEHGAYHVKLREFLEAFSKHKVKTKKQEGDAAAG
jgi:hypothetical protein